MCRDVLLQNVLLIVLFRFLHSSHCSVGAKHIPQSICSEDKAAMISNFHCNDPNVWFWRHHKLI
jgi:hypothetical protein